MERIDKLIRHPLWREALDAIETAEADRTFCRHGLPHLLDVARLAYLENLERGLGLPKETVYAAALLHDIGRGLQYARGIPHHEGGVRLAEPILGDCGFSEAERAEILGAIGGHRATETAEDGGLPGLLYRADKASRTCWHCAAAEECNWAPEKKNNTLKG